MSRNYKFHNPDGVYFVSFAVVKWLDVFKRKEFKDILLDNLHFYSREKGMEIYAWVIMTNHVHLVFRSIKGAKPEQLLGNFKRYTSKAIVKTMKENPSESSNAFFLKQFNESAKKSSNVKNYQVWRHDNQPIELWSTKITNIKINYIHMNPVKAGLVNKPELYGYSSAVDYSGKKGLLNGVVVVK